MELAFVLILGLLLLSFTEPERIDDFNSNY